MAQDFLVHRKARDVLVAQHDAAFAGFEIAGDGFQQGRLAAAVRPQQRHDFGLAGI
ncbi:hypothetical protein D3C71_2108750 [compost metagenome]